MDIFSEITEAIEQKPAAPAPADSQPAPAPKDTGKHIHEFGDDFKREFGERRT